jgi:hypothetical protein
MSAPAVARSPGPIYLPEDGLVKRASPTVREAGRHSGLFIVGRFSVAASCGASCGVDGE